MTTSHFNTDAPMCPTTKVNELQDLIVFLLGPSCSRQTITDFWNSGLLRTGVYLGMLHRLLKYTPCCQAAAYSSCSLSDF